MNHRHDAGCATAQNQPREQITAGAFNSEQPRKAPHPTTPPLMTPSHVKPPGSSTNPRSFAGVQDTPAGAPSEPAALAQLSSKRKGKAHPLPPSPCRLPPSCSFAYRWAVSHVFMPLACDALLLSQKLMGKAARTNRILCILGDQAARLCLNPAQTGISPASSQPATIAAQPFVLLCAHFLHL